MKKIAFIALLATSFIIHAAPTQVEFDTTFAASSNANKCKRKKDVVVIKFTDDVSVIDDSPPGIYHVVVSDGGGDGTFVGYFNSRPTAVQLKSLVGRKYCIGAINK